MKKRIWSLGTSTIGRWSYACSKLLDEFLGIAYWREKQVPVNVVRFFDTVGPRQTGQYGMVVPTFVRQALLGEPLTVFGVRKANEVFRLRGRCRGSLNSVRENSRRGGASHQYRQ